MAHLHHAISPSEPNLVPRREFIRDHYNLSSFSILALSGAALIRLYSFPTQVSVALRRLLDQTRTIVAYREDVPNNFCEFAIDGKPWSSPKSVATEKLLVDILAVLYRHGHGYLSTLDYGREQDDRVIIAFSRPTNALFQSPSGSASGLPRTSLGSSSAYPHAPPQTKVPFALSFPNTNILRVISPPLHSTPAILQTVRGSWPRGVVSERKVGDKVYEFKLKGYKWFQEDTFATDSLRHILALLSSLDGFGFTLLTSLSLTSRSRAKDLWIFTGVSEATLPESPPASPIASQADLRRPASSEQPRSAPHADGHAHMSRHRRAATDGDAKAAGAAMNIADAARSSHDADAARFSSLKPGVLRKPAPRAQLPVSVAVSTASNENLLAQGASVPQEPVRVTMASTVGSAENMTGIGVRKFQQEYAQAGQSVSPPAQAVPPVLYTSAARDTHNPYFPPAAGPSAQVDSAAVPDLGASSSAPQHSTSPSTSRIKPSPPHSTRNKGSPPPMGNTNGSATTERPHPKSSGSSTPPLLGGGAFRDSAFSSETSEVPITWTGVGREKEAPRAPSRTPVLPGGWVSPVQEREETTYPPPHGNGHAGPRTPDFGRPAGQITPERQEVRVVEPELVHPQPHAVRRSEAGVLDEMPRPPKERSTRPPQDREHSHDRTRGKEGPKGRTTTAGEGWVLVNIGPGTPSPGNPPTSSPKVVITPASLTPLSQSNAALHSSPRARDGSTPASSHHPTPRNAASSASPRSLPSSAKPARNGQPSSMSPAAKAIVIIDAMETKRAAADKAAEKDANAQNSSGLRRLFSLNSGPPKQASAKMRKPGPVEDSAGVRKNTSFEQEEKKTSRWRRKGPAAVSDAERRLSVE